MEIKSEFSFKGSNHFFVKIISLFKKIRFFSFFFATFIAWFTFSAKLKGLLKGAIGLARRVLKSNPVIDNANEILKLSGTKLTEDFLLEADEEVEFKKPKDAVKRFEILYKLSFSTLY